MSDHKIRWIFDTDYVRTEVICESTTGKCRLTCTQDCEEWQAPYEVDGVWLHDIENWDGSVTIATHAMRDTGECSFSDWFEDAPESGRGTFVIGEHPIATTWHGDHFRWRNPDAGVKP